MFCHFLASEGGHPTWEENSTEKNTRMQGPFFYCEGGFHDEPRFSFLKFNRLVDSLQNFEYEYNYKKRS